MRNWSRELPAEITMFIDASFITAVVMTALAIGAIILLRRFGNADPEGPPPRPRRKKA